MVFVSEQSHSQCLGKMYFAMAMKFTDWKTDQRQGGSYVNALCLVLF